MMYSTACCSVVTRVQIHSVLLMLSNRVVDVISLCVLADIFLRKGFELAVGTNHFAHFLLAHLLLKRLEVSLKQITVAGSFCTCVYNIHTQL
jgi:hypothetical protein